MPDGTEAIEDDEILYRRIPVSQNWYNPGQDPPLSPEAFKPNRHDLNGISLSRGKYDSIEDVGCEREGRKYFVAVIRAGDLTGKGIEVVPDPIKDHPGIDDDLGHVMIPKMNYVDRKEDLCREWKNVLATELCLRVEGPF